MTLCERTAYDMVFRSDDGTVELNGYDLTARLFARRLYHSRNATLNVVLNTGVGEVIRTGVSLWERIK